MAEERIYKIVHYVNQFYGGIGGEDFAHTAPFKQDGSVGSGRMLEGSSGGLIKIIGTVICGDNKFVEDSSALDEIIEMIRSYEPDGLLAGPAFLAGRYGEACTEVCLKASVELGIPVITGLASEHPSVDRFKKEISIVKTGTNGADMKNSLPIMGRTLLKAMRGEKLTDEEKSTLFKRGLKENILKEQTAAERAIDIIIKKYNCEPYTTEVPIPVYETVKPAPANMDEPLTVALITDGGLIRKGNPDKMPAGRPERFFKINIDGWERLSADELDANHFGYDTKYISQDPNRLVPLDVMRVYEKEGKVDIYPFIYTTAGVGAVMENAGIMGKGIAEELINAGIRAAILTST